jgi:hypothetical protein
MIHSNLYTSLDVTMTVVLRQTSHLLRLAYGFTKRVRRARNGRPEVQNGSNSKQPGPSKIILDISQQRILAPAIP